MLRANGIPNIHKVEIVGQYKYTLQNLEEEAVQSCRMWVWIFSSSSVPPSAPDSSSFPPSPVRAERLTLVAFAHSHAALMGCPIGIP